MKYIDLFEYKIIKMDKGYRDIVIIKNPSVDQILNLLKKSKGESLRGLNYGEDIYVWDAWFSEHYDVKEFLIDKLGIEFDLSDDEDHWFIHKAAELILLYAYNLENKRVKKLADSPMVRYSKP